MFGCRDSERAYWRMVLLAVAAAEHAGRSDDSADAAHQSSAGDLASH